jgi:hypothetical protein
MPTRARVETVIRGPATGGDQLSVMHFEYPAEVGDPDLTAQANESLARIRACWNEWRTIMANTATVTVGERVVTVDVDPAQVIPATPPAVVAGFASGNPLPWATQALATWITGGAVRGSQGRTFIPYVTETHNTTGILDTTGQNIVKAGIDKMFQPVGASPCTFILWHRERLADPDHVPPIEQRDAFSTIIAGGLARTKFAYLSSRRDT